MYQTHSAEIICVLAWRKGFTSDKEQFYCGSANVFTGLPLQYNLNLTYLEYVLNSQVLFKTHGAMETAAGSRATETDPS